MLARFTLAGCLEGAGLLSAAWCVRSNDTDAADAIRDELAARLDEGLLREALTAAVTTWAASGDLSAALATVVAATEDA